MVDLNTQFIIQYVFNFGGIVVNVIEMGWIEIVGGQGVFSIIRNFIKYFVFYINFL